MYFSLFPYFKAEEKKMYCQYIFKKKKKEKNQGESLHLVFRTRLYQQKNKSHSQLKNDFLQTFKNRFQFLQKCQGKTSKACLL